MKAKFFFSLAIVAVAFAALLGFGTLNTANAVPGENGFAPGTGNIFGADKATNAMPVMDKDTESDLGTHLIKSEEPLDTMRK